MAPADDTNNNVALRPRRRKYLLWQLPFRLLLSAYAIVVLAFLIRYIRRWNGECSPWHPDECRAYHASDNAACGIVACIATLGVTAWVVVAGTVLTNKPSHGAVICFDMLAWALGFAAMFVLAFASFSWESPSDAPRRPWLDDEYLVMIMICALWASHFVCCTGGCIGLCVRSCARKRRAKKPVVIRVENGETRLVPVELPGSNFLPVELPASNSEHKLVAVRQENGLMKVVPLNQTPR